MTLTPKRIAVMRHIARFKDKEGCLPSAPEIGAMEKRRDPSLRNPSGWAYDGINSLFWGNFVKPMGVTESNASTFDLTDAGREALARMDGGDDAGS